MPGRYSRASTLFYDVPLALLPSKAEEIRAFWETKLAGESIDFEDRAEPFAVTFAEIDDFVDDLEAPPAEPRRQGKVAIIPLHGVMSQRMNLMTAMSGGVSTEMVGAAFREQMNDPKVSAVVFDIDSPGGSTYGVTELANLIMASRGKKPLIGVANSMAASGAYWVGSALDRLYATPSALVGSVGVFMVHHDISQMAEKEGVRFTLIKAGKNKARGLEFQPLAQDDVEHFQSLVDDSYEMFIRDVARGRRTSRTAVRSGYGEGDVLAASQALNAGMIDGIKTLEEAVTGALSVRPSKVLGTSSEEELPEPRVDEAGLQRLARIRWRRMNERAAAASAAN